MTLIDTIILLIALGGLVVGYRKGLVKQLASIVSWVLGIVVTLFLGNEVTELFLAINPDAANWPLAGVTVKVVALSLFFLLVTLILRLVSHLVRGLMRAIHLGGIDKWGGAGLFVFKYLFLLSIVLNLWYAHDPDASTFGTRHMLGNKPYEFTLDLRPRVLGADVMPSDSLKLYRMEAAARAAGDEPSKNEM